MNDPSAVQQVVPADVLRNLDDPKRKRYLLRYCPHAALLCPLCDNGVRNEGAGND